MHRRQNLGVVEHPWLPQEIQGLGRVWEASVLEIELLPGGIVWTQEVYGRRAQ